MLSNVRSKTAFGGTCTGIGPHYRSTDWPFTDSKFPSESAYGSDILPHRIPGSFEGPDTAWFQNPSGYNTFDKRPEVREQDRRESRFGA